MLGVPYYWRTLDHDCIKDPKLHELIAAPTSSARGPWEDSARRRMLPIESRKH
jgi:hypothetical protein